MITQRPENLEKRASKIHTLIQLKKKDMGGSHIRRREDAYNRGRRQDSIGSESSPSKVLTKETIGKEG